MHSSKKQSGVCRDAIAPALICHAQRGFAQLKVLVTQNITRGTVFMPMHWGFLWGDTMEVNALTHPKVCLISLEIELKADTCKCEPTSGARSQVAHEP